MKKFIKGFLVFVVSCAIIGVFIGYFIGTMPVLNMGARGFMIAVSNGQYEQAYTLLTPGFQARVDFEAFKENVKATGLDQYKNVVWLQTVTYPEQKGGVVVGQVTTRQNTQFYVEFQFSLIQGKVWNDKAWLINNIRFPKEVNPAITPTHH